MNLIDTLQGLLRRWYIVVTGLVLAVAVAFGAWTVVTPGYERTATQLLLPGRGSLPGSSPNPYLFLGGLTYAADVLVRAVGSENLINEVTERYPGSSVVVSRDPTTSGPVILIAVTAKSDADAAEVLAMLVDRTAATLEQIQTDEGVNPRNRITVTSLTVDERSTVRQRTRLVVTVGAAGGVVVLSLLLASLVDGLLRSSSRGRRRDRSVADTVTEADVVPGWTFEENELKAASDEPESELEQGDPVWAADMVTESSESASAEGDVDPQEEDGPAGQSVRGEPGVTSDAAR